MALENISNVPQICSGTLRIAPRALQFLNCLRVPPNPAPYLPPIRLRRLGGTSCHPLSHLNISWPPPKSCIRHWFISGDEQLTVVSSEKDNSFKLVDLFMSLTYIKNNGGPNIDPCGTPHLMFSLCDFIFSNSIYRFLSDR